MAENIIETLENDKLKIGISSAGAELTSIFSIPRQQEYLWQGDPAWWPRRAPVLFPIVGKLNGNTYKVNGNSYSLPQHGFARDTTFELLRKGETSIAWVLRDSEQLLARYPFRFELVIAYALHGGSVTVSYTVRNPGSQPMLFSIGAHPGFALQPGESLNDYVIEFADKETLDRHLLEEGLFNGQTERMVSESSTLPLSDEMMKKDAVVFKKMQSSRITLKSRHSAYALIFDATGFPYFGIWSKPGSAFVCLEPWFGLADDKGFDGEFQDKEGIQMLAPAGTFTCSFTVTPA